MPNSVNGCHNTRIFMGNLTLAHPFGWRNDRWLQNVGKLQMGSFRDPIGVEPGSEVATKVTKSTTVTVEPTREPAQTGLPPGTKTETPPEPTPQPITTTVS